MEITKIEDIYREYNIHKAIIICNKDEIGDYHKGLLERDFSVLRSEYIEMLNDAENRILLIDAEAGLKAFDVDTTSINFDWITFVIYINTSTRIPALNHIHSIIL
jgi:hypothetical protein